MEVGNIFYMANTGKKKFLVATEKEAIDVLKKEPTEQGAAISKIEIQGDKWSVAQVSWQQIALKLLKGT
jgi:hypothetical protein